MKARRDETSRAVLAPQSGVLLGASRVRLLSTQISTHAAGYVGVVGSSGGAAAAGASDHVDAQYRRGGHSIARGGVLPSLPWCRASRRVPVPSLHRVPLPLAREHMRPRLHERGQRLPPLDPIQRAGRPARFDHVRAGRCGRGVEHYHAWRVGRGERQDRTGARGGTRLGAGLSRALPLSARHRGESPATGWHLLCPG